MKSRALWAKFFGVAISLLLVWSNPSSAIAYTYSGKTMNFVYPESVDITDCSNPARGAGYYGDVYRVSSDVSSLSLYIEAGSLSDPFVQVLDTDRRTVLGEDDDAGGGLNSFLDYPNPLTTGQYIIATTYGAGATGSYTLNSSAALTKITNCPQVITFTNPGSKVYGSDFTVNASTNMSLTVTVDSLTTSICSVANSNSPSFTIRPVTPGTCQLRATQSGNGSVAAAEPVTQSFTISAKPLTLTGLSANKDFDNNNTATVTGTPAISGVVGSDAAVLSGSITGATFDSVNAGARTVTVLGLSLTGTDANKYTFSPTFAATIAKINQTATWAPTTDLLPTNSGSQFAAGSTTGTGSITYAVTSAGTTGCSVSGRTLTYSGVGSCVVRMTAASNTNYNAATVDRTFSITRLTQAASWTPEVNLLVADSGVEFAAGVTNGGGTISYAVTNAGATGCTLSARVLTFTASGTCVVRMTAPANGDYAAATIDKSFVISKLAQTVNWTQKTQLESSPKTLPLNAATSSASGQITYSVQDAGTAQCSIANSELTFVGSGTCIVRAVAAETTTHAAGQLDLTLTISDPVVADPITPGSNLNNFDQPITTRGDELPKIADSTIKVLVDGYVQTVVPVTQLETAVSLDLGQGTTISLKTLGAEVHDEKSGSLVSERGGQLSLSGTGFAPDSQMTVWIFSTPVKLGVFQVDFFGKLTSNIKIPSNLPIGAHNLQLVSRFADGNVRAVMLKIQVNPAPIKLTIKVGSSKKNLILTNSEFSGKNLTSGGKQSVSTFLVGKKSVGSVSCEAKYTSSQSKVLVASRAAALCKFVSAKIKRTLPKSAIKILASK